MTTIFQLGTWNVELGTLMVRWSIRYRLFVPLALLMLGVVGISAWSAIASARQAEERIAAQNRRVSETLRDLGLSPNKHILQRMKGLSGAEYLHIDADGSRRSTFADPNISLSREILEQPADEREEHLLGLPIEVEGQRYRCSRLPEKSGGTYFIFYPEASLNQAIRDAIRPSLVFGLGGGLAAVLLMVLIGQGLVGRLRALERRTRQIAGGDFSPMPLPRQNDEMRDLAQSVNEMAERLAKFQETVQKSERLRLLGQVSGGLAHQLRNSVTGAKLALQLHLADCSQSDDESLQVTLRQLNLMEANLRRFMNLGKHETSQRTRCSLATLIEEVLTLYRAQCKHAQIEVQFNRGSEPLELEGDAEQLRDLFMNLIGNAIEATGPVGRVEITMGSDPNRFVEIADTGPGPPPAIAERLFEPFVTGKPEGIGLGLAIARQIAEEHGGTISWRRASGKTIFRIQWPAS